MPKCLMEGNVSPQASVPPEPLLPFLVKQASFISSPWSVTCKSEFFMFELPSVRRIIWMPCCREALSI
jgi:hypothetical protein